MLGDWESRREVRKGNMGEAIIRRALMAAGLYPYRPDFDGPHPIDRVAFNPKTKSVVLFDSKCKAARYHYEDTGFNVRHYERYCIWNETLPVFIGFVDEEWGRVYGNFLDNLIKPKEPKRLFGRFGREYPSIENGIIFFPLTNMQLIGLVKQTECGEISALRSTQHEKKFRYEFPVLEPFSLEKT